MLKWIIDWYLRFSEDTQQIERVDMLHPLGGSVDIGEFKKRQISRMNLQYLWSCAIYWLSVFSRLELLTQGTFEALHQRVWTRYECARFGTPFPATTLHPRKNNPMRCMELYKCMAHWYLTFTRHHRELHHQNQWWYGEIVPTWCLRNILAIYWVAF